LYIAYELIVPIDLQCQRFFFKIMKIEQNEMDGEKKDHKTMKTEEEDDLP
jgi:hypothetical protein